MDWLIRRDALDGPPPSRLASQPARVKYVRKPHNGRNLTTSRFNATQCMAWTWVLFDRASSRAREAAAKLTGKGRPDVPVQSFDLPRACAGGRPGRGEDVLVQAGCSSFGRASRPWSGLPPTATTSRGRCARCSTTCALVPDEATQMRVYRVIEQHMALAAEYVDSQAREGVTFDGSPLCCHATHAQGNRVPARAAAGQQVLPVAQAPRRGLRGRRRVSPASAGRARVSAAPGV